MSAVGVSGRFYPLDMYLDHGGGLICLSKSLTILSACMFLLELIVISTSLESVLSYDGVGSFGKDMTITLLELVRVMKSDNNKRNHFLVKPA